MPTMISRSQMNQQLERLKDHKVERRYTLSDVAFLTDWSPNWLLLMEKRGEIPKAKSGRRKHGRRGGLRWTESSVRKIIALKIERMKARTH